MSCVLSSMYMCTETPSGVDSPPAHPVIAELEAMEAQYRSLAGSLDPFDAYWRGKADAYRRVAGNIKSRLATLRGGE